MLADNYGPPSWSGAPTQRTPEAPTSCAREAFGRRFPRLRRDLADLERGARQRVLRVQKPVLPGGDAPVRHVSILRHPWLDQPRLCGKGGAHRRSWSWPPGDCGADSDAHLPRRKRNRAVTIPAIRGGQFARWLGHGPGTSESVSRTEERRVGKECR